MRIVELLNEIADRKKELREYRELKDYCKKFLSIDLREKVLKDIDGLGLELNSNLEKLEEKQKMFKETYGPDGYNIFGFDEQGYDREGYNENGYNEEGYNRDGYDENGFDCDGYDADGFDEYGEDREGNKRED